MEPRVGLVGFQIPPADPAASILERVQSEVGAVPVLYRALANAPALLEAWIGLGWTLRKDTELSSKWAELIILRVAQLMGSDYVWRTHVGLARKAGVSDQQMQALGSWRSSEAFAEDECGLLALAEELAVEGAVTQITWANATALLSDREAVEVVLTAAWYSCVCRTVAALGIPLEQHHARVAAVETRG